MKKIIIGLSCIPSIFIYLTILWRCSKPVYLNSAAMDFREVMDISLLLILSLFLVIAAGFSTISMKD